MKEKLNFIISYLKYLVVAKNAHGLHSPFVFDLYNELINNKNEYYCYELIESVRAKMLLDNSYVEVDDYGAGSKINNTSKRRVSSIAKHAVKPVKYSHLLFRLANRFQPTTIIELGTSLGISTCYLASAVRKASIFTLEGSTEIAKIAQSNFDKLKLNNIKLLTGKFDNNLENVLKESKKIDMVFIDGNHHKEPTLRYFEQCLKYSHKDTIIIIDDIYWSNEMQNAWKTIIAMPNVSVSIDLFFMGIIFFRKEQVKENFVIRF